VTIVYIGGAKGTPWAADDAQNVDLFDPDVLPSPMAFDHRDILADYRRFLRTGEHPAPWRRTVKP
jgi:8-oxo-dGTP diphosphatase